MLNKHSKKYISLFLLLLLLISTTAYSINKDTQVLQSWADDSSNKQKIIAFVKAVTDKNSKDFVPVQDRIATFDMDGTIACEEPLWIELAVAEYKIMTDMRDNKELVAEVNRLNQDLKQDPEPAETGQLIDDVTTQAFVNIPEENFTKYTSDFMLKYKPEFTNLQYKDTFYKPMVELIDYLLDNDFQVYIVSGSQNGTIWGACKETLPQIPRSHEIGADIALKPLNQTNPSDSNYIFQQNDDLIRQTTFTQKDLKMWKVYNIYNQIGSKPILAFGNTDGDFSMLNYAKSNKQYKSVSFLLCHDDNKREYDYNKAQRADWNATAKANNWNVVFMSKEFKQVFMKETSKK